MTFVLIFNLIFPASVFAGPLEALSTGAYFFSDGVCPGYDGPKAAAELDKMDACHRSALNGQAADLGAISNQISSNAQDKYFAMLGAQHALELRCAASFADGVKPEAAEVTADLIDKMKNLRAAKQRLVDASMNLATNGRIAQKFCPLTIEDLSPDMIPPGDPAPNPHDSFFETCKAIIQNRTAYDMIYNSIPLSNTPPMMALLEEYANMGGAGLTRPRLKAYEAALGKKLQQAYQAAKPMVLEQADKIQTVADGGGSGFDRGARHALLSDPAVINKVLRGASADTKGVACQANSEYGKGAENLEIAFNGILVGTMVLSLGAGAIIRGGAIGGEAAMAAAGRAAGGLSINALRVFQFANFAAAGTVMYSTYASQCGNHSADAAAAHGTSDNNQCVSAPKIGQLTQDSCYVAMGLASLGLVTALPGEKIAGMVKRFIGGQPVTPAAPSAILSAEDATYVTQAMKDAGDGNTPYVFTHRPDITKPAANTNLNPKDQNVTKYFDRNGNPVTKATTSEMGDMLRFEKITQFQDGSATIGANPLGFTYRTGSQLRASTGVVEGDASMIGSVLTKHGNATDIAVQQVRNTQAGFIQVDPRGMLQPGRLPINPGVADTRTYPRDLLGKNVTGAYLAQGNSGATMYTYSGQVTRVFATETVNDYGMKFLSGAYAEIRIGADRIVTVPIDQGMFIKP